MTTTTTTVDQAAPSAVAQLLGERLGALLAEIRATFEPLAVPAIGAAERGDCAAARQIITDADHIANAAERLAGPGVDLMATVGALTSTFEVDDALEVFDPERERRYDDLVARPRTEGQWSAEDDEREAASREAARRDYFARKAAK